MRRGNRQASVRRFVRLTAEQLEPRELLAVTTVDVGLGSILSGGNADTPTAPTFRDGVPSAYGVPSWKTLTNPPTYTPILPSQNEGTAFDQIPQTNDWWSPLFWRQQGPTVTPPSIYPAPFAVQFLTSSQTGQPGLIVGFPSQVAIDWLGQVESGGTNLDIRETIYRYPLSYTSSSGSANPGYYGHTAEAFNLGNFSISVAGATLTDPSQIKVEGYSDWAVTASWGSDTTRVNVTMGQGLPFMYFNPPSGQSAAQITFTYTNLPASTSVDFHDNGDGTAYFGVPTEVQPGVVHTVYYGVFGMTNASFASTATEVTITPDTNDPYFSLALLPPAFQPQTDATVADTIYSQFKETAYAELTNTQVSYQYDTGTNQVITTLGAPQSGITFHNRTFTDGTTLVDTPLFALLPHQYTGQTQLSLLNGLFDYGGATSTGTQGVTTATTLTDSTQSWTPGQFAGATVVITSGTSAGTWAQVTSNTATQLTFANWSSTLTNGTYSYEVLTPLSRGVMKLLVGSNFTVDSSTVTGFQTTYDHTSGMLPFLPPGGALTLDSGTLDNTYTNQPLTLTLVQEIEKIAFASPPALGDQGDTYGMGKLLLKLANLIPIADQLTTDPGVSASDQANMALARQKLINLVEDALVRWFQATQDYQFFYYNTDWNTLIGYQPSFGTDTDLNDHHFHYGYFLHAAGIVALYDPNFLAQGVNGGTDNFAGLLKLLARDVANWDRQSPTDQGMVFPFLRFFNPYVGHSYASGHGFFSDGNNQESSSESMNFSAGLALLGEALMSLGDPDGQAMRDLGVALYETETRSIEQYTFDIDGQVFPFGFNNYDPVFGGSFPGTVITPAIGNGLPLTQTAQQWDSGGQNAIFFNSNFAEAPFSIDWLPISGSSLYLGRSVTYAQNNWATYEQNITNFADDPTFGTTYPYPIYPGTDWGYQALSDPGASGTATTAATGAVANYLMYYNAGGINQGFDIGESSAMTFRWITTLGQYGSVDGNIRATGASQWAAFNNAGTVTYVAYNPSSSPITVSFTDPTNSSNNTTLTNIPARSMAYKTGPSGTQMTYSLPPVPTVPQINPVTFYFSNTGSGGITGGTLSTTPGDRSATTTLVTMPSTGAPFSPIPPTTDTTVARFTLTGINTTGTVPANVTGTATGGTATSLSDSTAAWTANQYAGYLLFISAGTGSGQSRIVGQNTADTLFVTKAWQTTPDNTSQYILYPISQLNLWLHDNSFSATSGPSGSAPIVGVGVRYMFNGGPPSNDNDWDRQELFLPSGAGAAGAPPASETNVPFGYDLWNLYTTVRVDGLQLFGFPMPAGQQWQQFQGGTIQVTVWVQNNNGTTHNVDLSVNSIEALGRQSTLSLPAGYVLSTLGGPSPERSVGAASTPAGVLQPVQTAIARVRVRRGMVEGVGVTSIVVLFDGVYDVRPRAFRLRLRNGQPVRPVVEVRVKDGRTRAILTFPDGLDLGGLHILGRQIRDAAGMVLAGVWKRSFPA